MSLWYFCSMLLNMAYTSNLRAFILLPSVGKLIDSDNDVVTHAGEALFPVWEHEVERFSDQD